MAQRQKFSTGFTTPSNLEYKIKTMNGGTMWKFVTTALLSMSITMAVGWFAVGKDFNEIKAKLVSVEQVEHIIATRSPYLQDKKMLDKIPVTLDVLLEKVEKQNERLARIEAVMELNYTNIKTIKQRTKP